MEAIMGYREPKRLTPPAAAGVKGIVAARARTRRETQRSLSEISSHAPPATQRSCPGAPFGEPLSRQPAPSLPAGEAARRQAERQAPGQHRKVRPMPANPDRG